MPTLSVAVSPPPIGHPGRVHLSVEDLRRQILDNYGITVDPGTLQELMAAAPVERTDLAAAGATAAVLGLGLDDLFSVEVVPVPLDLPESDTVLSPEKSRRLDEIFDRQDNGTITEAETVELDALAAEHGHLLHERNLLAIAATRGQPVETVQADLAADIAKAVEWLKAFEADPERQQALATAAKRHHSSRPLLFEG